MSEVEPRPEPLEGKNLYQYHHRLAFACEQLVGLKVLDLFGDLGGNSAKIADVASEVVGLDPASDVIRRGERGGLPFEDDQFDAVVSLKVLAPSDITETLAREIRRVLRPEGFVLLSIAHARGVEAGEGVGLKRLADHFPQISLFGQRMIAGSAVSPLSAGHITPNAADYRGYRTTGGGGRETKTGAGVVRFTGPEVLICLASEVGVPHVPGPDSIFLMDSIDIWADLVEACSQPAALAQNMDYLSAELQHARVRIDTLTEIRDSLERGVATAGSDLSPVGPMMQALAGEPIPADMPHLVKLLGDIAVRFVRHENEIEGIRSRADAEITALTERRRRLRVELDEIGLEAEEQADIVAAVIARARDDAAGLAAQVEQKSARLNEVLEDLARASIRESAALEANSVLTSSHDDLSARLSALEASKQAVEQQLATALRKAEEALLKEAAAQAEVLRQLEVQAELIAAHREATAELLAKDGLVGSQGLEISRLGAALLEAGSALESQRLIAERQAVELSDLNAAALAHAVREQELNATVRDMTLAEAELNAELRRLVSERTAEQAVWLTEQDAWLTEREALTLERTSWIAERDSWKSALRFKNAEFDALSVELEALRSERAEMVSQQDAGVSERLAYQLERDAWAGERERWEAERADLDRALSEVSDRFRQEATLPQKRNWWERLGQRRRPA